MHGSVREVTVAKKAPRKSRKPAKKTKTRSRPRRSTAAKASQKKTAARSARKRGQKKPPPKPSTLSSSATLLRGAIAGAVATVTGKAGSGAAHPDAVEILEREHRRFEDLLKQGEETTERARGTRRELLTTLTSELNAHEVMEERVLYPALKAHPQAREIVLEGFEEHHVADLIVKELHEVATNEEAWGAKFKVLKENIEHHIEEEEGNMFRLARGIFSREELRLLGARMLKIRPGT